MCRGLWQANICDDRTRIVGAIGQQQLYRILNAFGQRVKVNFQHVLAGGQSLFECLRHAAAQRTQLFGQEQLDDNATKHLQLSRSMLSDDLFEIARRILNVQVFVIVIVQALRVFHQILFEAIGEYAVGEAADAVLDADSCQLMIDDLPGEALVARIRVERFRHEDAHILDSIQSRNRIIVFG